MPMLRSLPLCLCLSLAIGGCAQISTSRFNPLNWFGPSQPVAQPVAQTTDAAAPDTALRPLVPENRQVVVTDARVLVAQITELRIEPLPSGAIIRATGIATTQGFFNAELVPVGVENGRLTLEFRVESPTGFAPTGTAATRRITVALEIDNAGLAAIRSIRVQAAQNALQSSR